MIPPVVIAAAAHAAAAPVTLPGGTIATDVKVGTGRVAEPGLLVSVHYTGWLYEGGKRGKKFDSSRDRNEPFRFPLGAGDVIPGWDAGVAGMKVGGKRTLIVPPAQGYGADGAGDDIPPNATLIFDVELLSVDEPVAPSPALPALLAMGHTPRHDGHPGERVADA